MSVTRPTRTKSMVGCGWGLVHTHVCCSKAVTQSATQCRGRTGGGPRPSCRREAGRGLPVFCHLPGRGAPLACSCRPLLPSSSSLGHEEHLICKLGRKDGCVLTESMRSAPPARQSASLGPCPVREAFSIRHSPGTPRKGFCLILGLSSRKPT